jgi:hypothetical protein
VRRGLGAGDRARGPSGTPTARPRRHDVAS